MPSELFNEAKARMKVELANAGHKSILGPTPDNNHPLHELFLDTRTLLEKFFQCESKAVAANRVACRRSSIRKSLQRYKDLSDRAEYENIKLPPQKDLPSHAQVLALRFASQKERSNSNIVSLLAALNWLYLWHIPPHFVTKAQMPETNDDAKDLGTESAPIEGGDTNLEMALSIGITDVDRKLEAIQHARKDLEDRLAVMREAEATVLKARSAMGQVGNAMAMADNALLQSPMSILARKH
ncbi:uncharacterized protein BBA_08417 [Beauveria bassiana ARSEF 2860]|uniref:Uncharacterized protein n=1 Tax=Beauveria bassiana (strain ARSEF 2860) TaxID=655819 RepID=J4UHK0_BEAB2|nr:uncharacterized protein BBA_08417 [Beauveria bassiana ARSEF 2860]EJP62702.1 hypothetical protein BBA_08417 [Beauveria bassiana ARSEF 2860]